MGSIAIPVLGKGVFEQENSPEISNYPMYSGTPLCVSLPSLLTHRTKASYRRSSKATKGRSVPPEKESPKRITKRYLSQDNEHRRFVVTDLTSMPEGVRAAAGIVGGGGGRGRGHLRPPLGSGWPRPSACSCTLSSRVGFVFRIRTTAVYREGGTQRRA